MPVITTTQIVGQANRRHLPYSVTNQVTRHWLLVLRCQETALYVYLASCFLELWFFYICFAAKLHLQLWVTVVLSLLHVCLYICRGGNSPGSLHPRRCSAAWWTLWPSSPSSLYFPGCLWRDSIYIGSWSTRSTSHDPSYWLFLGGVSIVYYHFQLPFWQTMVTCCCKVGLQMLPSLPCGVQTCSFCIGLLFILCLLTSDGFHKTQTCS